ncbi:hypothetical protein MP638_002157 [Amoeboaphelidium occidentale]|nr:hypothetical protein MP638_002157 [Amoeboaphelidium occidentale]
MLKNLAKDLYNDVSKKVLQKMNDQHIFNKNSEESSYQCCPNMDWSKPESVVMPNGDKVPDFSRTGCWYGLMQKPDQMLRSGNIPSSVMIITLEPAGDCRDRTKDIHDALEKISKNPIDNDTQLRGVLLFRNGDYYVSSSAGFNIKTSGVLVTGEIPPKDIDTSKGFNKAENRVKIHCTSQNAGTLFTVEGHQANAKDDPERRFKIVGERLPVGETLVQLDNVNGLKQWQNIRIVRKSNKDWISHIHMDKIPERPGVGGTKQWGPFDLVFERKIISIIPEKNQIVLDCGLTTAIESKYGGGYCYVFDENYRIRNVGIQYLDVECALGPEVCSKKESKFGVDVIEDENHMDRFALFRHAMFCWVKSVNVYHFGFHTRLGDGAKNISVINCGYFEPTGKCTGGKRYGFMMVGTYLLVESCFCDKARHAYAVDARVTGPNVYFNCRATNNLGASETHHRWGNGVLYDHCECNISIQDRGYMGSGQGWSGANCLVWNCTGNITVQHPPGAFNYCIGSRGRANQGKESFPKQNYHDSYVWMDSKAMPWSLLTYQRGLKK